MMWLATYAIALILYAVFDVVWFKLVAGSFFVRELGPALNIANGALVVRWTPAILVYILLALGTAAIVLPLSTSVATAAAYGAVLGLIIYGVYDLTNLALLAHWTWKAAILDVVWGAASGAAIGALVKYAAIRF